VLLLPLDVANARDGKYNIKMDKLWQISYMIIAAYIFVVVPLSLFFYEEDEESNCCQRVKRALLMEFFLLVFLGLLFGISYIFLKKAELPVRSTEIDFNQLGNGLASTGITSHKSETLIVNVSFPIYAMSLMSLFGWVLFVIFCGVGLTALPMDMILAYRYMPKRITREEHQAKRIKLKKDVESLINSGEELKKDYTKAMSVQGWFKGMRAKGKIKNEMRLYEAATIQVEFVIELLRIRMFLSSNPTTIRT
jgi:LMBR1 domain-containing protein 1